MPVPFPGPPQMKPTRHLPCSIPNCGSSRRLGHSGYCASHAHRQIQYGHPLGRAVFPREYRRHERIVEALLNRHPDHPGTLTALAWIERLLDSREHPRHPARLWLQAMHESGITARQVLVRLTAAYLLTYELHDLKGGLQGEDHLVGRAVLRLSPCARKSPSGYHSGWPAKAVRGLASTLRTTLAPLLGQVRLALAADEARSAEQAQVLATPFG